MSLFTLGYLGVKGHFFVISELIFFFCFQNDIENVFPFVFLGFLYISTNPTLAGAKLAFRIFTAARFLHSIVYVFAVSNKYYIIILHIGKIFFYIFLSSNASNYQSLWVYSTKNSIEFFF